MRNYAILPGNLDVRELISKDPPQIPNFTLEKLLQIIDAICREKTYSKWEKHKEHVQIMSRTLSKVAHDYLLYVNYLRRNGILLCDEIARPAKDYPLDPKSFGFRFTRPYSLSYQLFDMTTLSKQERRITRKKSTAASKSEEYAILRNEYPFIKFLDNLELDWQGSLKWVDRLKGQIDNDYSMTDDERERAVITLTSYLAVLDQFTTAPSRKVIIDKTGNRLHSPLTRLKKELRSFLSYKGEGLVSLDLKNSQPFFSLVLLKPDFWVSIIDYEIDGRTKKGKAILNNVIGRRLFIDSNTTKGRLRKWLNIADLYPEHARKLWRVGEDRESDGLSTPASTTGQAGGGVEGRSTDGAISILKWISLQLIGSEEYEEFRKKAANGEIYEDLIPALEGLMASDSRVIEVLKGESIEWSTGRATKRKAVKELMVRAMFAPNRSHKLVTQIAFEMLRAAYPKIEYLFRLIRGGDHKVLARLLQRIESFVILKACIRTINNKIKHVPIWTIHDSIITTEKHKDRVEKIMRETIASYVGVEPKINSELWSELKPDEITLEEMLAEDDIQSEFNEGSLED